jgi:hypothetical protein
MLDCRLMMRLAAAIMAPGRRASSGDGMTIMRARAMNLVSVLAGMMFLFLMFGRHVEKSSRTKNSDIGEQSALDFRFQLILGEIIGRIGLASGLAGEDAAKTCVADESLATVPIVGQLELPLALRTLGDDRIAKNGHIK